MTTNRPRLLITDHALIRYMERVQKIEIDAYRKADKVENDSEMITRLQEEGFPTTQLKIDLTKKLSRFYSGGQSQSIIIEKYRYIIENSVLVSVVPISNGHHTIIRHRRQARRPDKYSRRDFDRDKYEVNI